MDAGVHDPNEPWLADALSMPLHVMHRIYIKLAEQIISSCVFGAYLRESIIIIYFQ